jgi:acetyl-CoA acetyltransferase
MTSRPGVAIAGAGLVGLGRFEDESVASVASRAVGAALADCGLSRADVDGLFLHIGQPRGLDYDEIARLLALDVQVVMQPWSHGRFAATVFGAAWQAVALNLVTCALCVAVWKPGGRRAGSRDGAMFAETLREGGGPHAETPWAGAVAPVFGAALATRAYFDRHKLDLGLLGAVAVAQRKAAQRNPVALMRRPMSAGDYAAARFIVEPLRLFDCSVPAGLGAAFVLTSAERAKDLRQAPVFVRGWQGSHAGPDEYIFGQPGLGVDQANVFDYRPAGPGEPVFRRAGVSPQDIDALYCYDGFSPQVLWTLERFGYCEPGEAAHFVQHGRIELNGELPVNTSGGHLSEGHSNGWGSFAEIVCQLRGQAGERQVKGARLAQWATTLGDSVIFGADAA